MYIRREATLKLKIFHKFNAWTFPFHEIPCWEPTYCWCKKSSTSWYGKYPRWWWPDFWTINSITDPSRHFGVEWLTTFQVCWDMFVFWMVGEIFSSNFSSMNLHTSTHFPAVSLPAFHLLYLGKTKMVQIWAPRERGNGQSGIYKPWYTLIYQLTLCSIINNTP